jgi:hypothetical protein
LIGLCFVSLWILRRSLLLFRQGCLAIGFGVEFALPDRVFRQGCLAIGFGVEFALPDRVFRQGYLKPRFCFDFKGKWGSDRVFRQGVQTGLSEWVV